MVTGIVSDLLELFLLFVSIRVPPVKRGNIHKVHHVCGGWRVVGGIMASMVGCYIWWGSLDK